VSIFGSSTALGLGSIAAGVIRDIRQK
jgi:hypothetical protein